MQSAEKRHFFGGLALKEGDLPELLTVFRRPFIVFALSRQLNPNDLMTAPEPLRSRVAAVDVERSEVVPDEDDPFQWFNPSLKWGT